MPSGHITPTICFGGNLYSISTLCTYCCIDGRLIMRQSSYSSRANSGYRLKIIGGTSLWASSRVSPDFSRNFCEQTILRLMRSRSHTVFVVASIRSRHAGEFILIVTLITFGDAMVLTNMGGPTLRFRATTFMVLGHFCQRCGGSLNVIKARFQLLLRGDIGVDTTEDKLVGLMSCKMFETCFRALSQADAKERAGSFHTCSVLTDGKNPFSKTTTFFKRSQVNISCGLFDGAVRFDSSTSRVKRLLIRRAY